MRLAGRLVLERFGTAYPDSKGPLDAWVAEILAATWANPHELKARYANASVLGGGRVVFNIGGNKYRLVVLIDYRNQQCLVERIGTHEEYEKWSL